MDIEALQSQVNELKIKLATLEHLIAQLPGHVYWKDTNGKYLGCNNEFAKTLRFTSPAEIAGKTDADFLPEERAAIIMHNDQQIMQGNQTKFIEEIGHDGNGNPGFYLSIKTPLLDTEGKKQGLLGISFNITEQKNAAEKNNQQLQFFNTTYLADIFGDLPVSLYWLDKESRVVACNNFSAKALGFKKAPDVLGKNLLEIAKLQNWESGLAEKMRENDLEIMATQQFQEYEEIGLLNGEYRTFFSGKHPWFNNAGEVIGVYGFAIDITDRKELEKKLREEKEKNERIHLANANYLDSILENLPINLYWVNHQGYILACNKNQAKTLGFDDPQKVIQKSYFDILESEEANKLHENNMLVIKSGKAIEIEEPAYIDGEHKIYLAGKCPLKDHNGNIIGVFGFGFDITERKQFENFLRKAKEQAEAADKAKAEFIANMSHDLRTPFSGILTMTEYLQKREEEPVKKNLLKDVADSAKALISLLNQVLESSKQSNHPVEKTTFNVKAAIEEIIRLMGAQANTKGLKINLDCPDQFITNDRLRIIRITLNLLGNALKFTTEGHVDITVKTKKPNLIITVSDTGIGIPKDKLAIIFDRFTKLQGSYGEKNFQGSGLGLYIAKQYALDLQGDISVESSVGKGTTFTVVIPL